MGPSHILLPQEQQQQYSESASSTFRKTRLELINYISTSETDKPDGLGEKRERGKQKRKK